MSRRRYSAGLNLSGNYAAGAVYAEMLAGASEPISVRAIRVTSGGAAGALAIGVVRSSRVGSGTSVFTGVPHLTTSTAAVGAVRSSWSLSPTQMAGEARLVNALVAGATGSVVDVLREDDGPIHLEPGTSLLVLNQASGINANPLHLTFTWEECLR